MKKAEFARLLAKKRAGSKKKSAFDVKKMQSRTQRDKNKFTKFKNGATKLVFARNVGTHTDNWGEPKVRFWLPNPNAEEGRQTVKIVSPKSLDESAHCPAMSAYETLRNDSADDALLDDFRPQSKFLVNAFVLDGAVFKHAIMELPQGVYDAVSDAIGAELTAEDFDEAGSLIGEPPIVGDGKWRLIQVTRTGTGKFDTKYRTTVTSKVVKLSQKLLKKRVDLVKVEPVTPTAKIEKIVQALLGDSGGASDVDDEDVDYEDIFEKGDEDVLSEVPGCIGEYVEIVHSDPKKCKACNVRVDCKELG